MRGYLYEHPILDCLWASHFLSDLGLYHNCNSKIIRGEIMKPFLKGASIGSTLMALIYAGLGKPETTIALSVVAFVFLTISDRYT